MLAARIGALVLALVGCAWFALGARQAHQTARANAIVSSSQRLSPGRARRAAAALEAAGTLNPDLQVDVLRAELAIDQGRPRTARRILASVTRREPQNLNAWLQLARASTGDRVSFFAAEIHIRTLVRVPGSR
jgi:predicted Zn-dependent protease